MAARLSCSTVELLELKLSTPFHSLTEPPTDIIHLEANARQARLTTSNRIFLSTVQTHTFPFRPYPYPLLHSPSVMTTPGGPADATLGIQPAIPVHNLAVKSEIVPGGRRRQSVIAGGITKTENLIDLGAARKAERDINAPNFFVLVSETSLFAGQPNISGAIDGPCSIAKFNTPSDIVVDRNQQLFIADTDNARIRRISKQGIVSTVAAIGGGGQTTNTHTGR